MRNKSAYYNNGCSKFSFGITKNNYILKYNKIVIILHNITVFYCILDQINSGLEETY